MFMQTFLDSGPKGMHSRYVPVYLFFNDMFFIGIDFFGIGEHYVLIGK